MSIRFNAERDGNDAHRTSATTLGRQAFVAELEDRKMKADREAGGFVLCLVDVDQLRNVNDGHGQAAGDAVLNGVAQRLLSVLDLQRGRPLEYRRARFDGDSFMLLLPGCRLRDGEALAERVRRDCSAASFCAGVRITVSIAVTAYRSGETVDALLARTEKTLHLAKQFGCDRVETAWTPEARRDCAGVTVLAESAGAKVASGTRAH